MPYLPSLWNLFRGPIVALLAFITGVAINNPNHDASLLYFQPTECAASNQTFLQT